MAAIQSATGEEPDSDAAMYEVDEALQTITAAMERDDISALFARLQTALDGLR